jgi:hypothetical protein
MPKARRVIKVTITARRVTVLFPGRRRPDHWFPQVGRSGTGFPERCRGVYLVPEGKTTGVWFSDGTTLIKRIDDWIAKGYKDEPQA